MNTEKHTFGNEGFSRMFCLRQGDNIQQNPCYLLAVGLFTAYYFVQWLLKMSGSEKHIEN